MISTCRPAPFGASATPSRPRPARALSAERLRPTAGLGCDTHAADRPHRGLPPRRPVREPRRGCASPRPRRRARGVHARLHARHRARRTRARDRGRPLRAQRRRPRRAAPRARAARARDRGRHRRRHRQRQPRPRARARPARAGGLHARARRTSRSSSSLRTPDGATLGHVVAVGHAGAAESANLARCCRPRRARARSPCCTRRSTAPRAPASATPPARPRISTAATRTGRSAMCTCASRCARSRPPGIRAASRRTTWASPAPRARSWSRSTPRVAPRSSSSRSRRCASSGCDSTTSRLPGWPVSRDRRCSPSRRPSRAPPERSSSCASSCGALAARPRPARPRGAQQLGRGARARPGRAQRGAALRAPAPAARARPAPRPAAPARCGARARDPRGSRRDALLEELAPAVLAGDDSADPAARRAYLAEPARRARRDVGGGAAGRGRPVRIDRLHVGAYGPLAELELSGLAEDDLVVVYGPNEAGKSSLRSFVASMLYGFSPASREDHPATPLDGHAHGELELVLPGRRARARGAAPARPARGPRLARRGAGRARQPAPVRSRLARARHVPGAARLRLRRAARARRRDLARDRAAAAGRRVARLPAPGGDRRAGALERRGRALARRPPRQAALGGAVGAARAAARAAA